MLAQLAAHTDPVLGRLSGRLDSKSARAAVMLGGLVGVGLVLLIVMAVVGALL